MAAESTAASIARPILRMPIKLFPRFPPMPPPFHISLFYIHPGKEIQKEQEKAYLVLLPLYFFLVHYVDLDISILFLEDYSSYRTFFFVQKSVN